LVLKSCILLIFCTWILNFSNFLDYGWTWTEFENSGLQIWIAKYDGPLIHAASLCLQYMHHYDLRH